MYRRAVKSLPLPWRKQARKHVRDVRDFNNIETRAVIKVFFFLQGKAPKEIHIILRETLACFLPGRAKDLSASLYVEVLKSVSEKRLVTWQPRAAFEGGKWGDCPRPRSWGGPALQAYEFVKLYSPVNWKCWFMLRLKNPFSRSNSVVENLDVFCTVIAFEIWNYRQWKRLFWKYFCRE